MEFKNIIGKNFKAPKVKDAVLELETVEEEWAEFLAESEKMMDLSKESTALTKLGDKVNLDYQLMDARTQKIKTIGNVVEDLNAKHLVLILLRHFA